MRQWRDILNALDVHSSSRECRDRALATAPRPADPHLQILHSELRSLFGGLLSRTLARKGSALAAPLEAASAAAGPTERIAPRIGDGDSGVVEAGIDVGNPSRNTFLFGFGNLGHK